MVIRWGDLVETRWRNGGGITRVLRDGAHWRLSIADMDRDAAFSAFGGMMRILTVVDGAGVTLHTGDGRPTGCEFARPVRFDGGAQVHAVLNDGPVRNFNLMYDAAQYAVEASCLAEGDSVFAGDADMTRVFHVIRGQAEAGGETGIDLARRDTVIAASTPCRLRFSPDDLVLAISLHRRHRTDRAGGQSDADRPSTT